MMLDGNVVQDVDIFLKEHYQKINDEKKILQDILNIVKSSDDILNNEVEGRIGQEPKHSESSDASSMRRPHQDDCLGATLRYGDFFLLNPVFQISNRPMFGFGECEEQRKRFLAEKKHEYLQYLTKTENEEEKPKKKELNTSKADNRQNINVSTLSCPKLVQRTLRIPREIFSPGRGLVEETDRCFKRWQQQVYKRELDEQVLERRKRLDEEKMRDRDECKMRQDDMMLECSRFSQSPINHSTLDQNSNNAMIKQNETNSLEHLVARKKNVNAPSSEQDTSSPRNYKPKSEYDSGDFLKNSLHSDELPKDSNGSDSDHISSDQLGESQQFGKRFSNQSSESNRNHSVSYATHKLQEYAPTFSETAKSDGIEPETKSDSKITSDEIANSKAYQKLRQERYKNELARQIEEKNRLKMERKIEEEKEEKKLEWKAKQEEEKLRLEFERKQAEIAYRAAQKVQQELRHQEFLNKIHEKKAYERKKNVEPISELTFSKALVHPTAHYRATDEGRVTKNIHFPIASRTDYNKNEMRDDENTLKRNPKSDSDMVIEAPYMLAVQGDFCSQNSNAVDDLERPSSPPVPAITTKKILKCQPKIEGFIPSTVSMAEKTKKQFVKDSTLLANLSEIRRKLLERQRITSE